MHSNLVIKQQKSKPWYVGMGAVIALLFTSTFLMGRFLAIGDLAETKEKLIQVESELEQTQGELKDVSESLVMQRQSSQVDNLSSKELVNSVKDLQRSNNELEEELTFYRKIMAPELEKDGLGIDSVQITVTDKPSRFHFRTTLIQAGKQSQFLKGSVLIKFHGELDGKTKEFDIRELGTFNTKLFQFQFKYFQNIQGFIELPDGFSVKTIDLVARTKGLRKNQSVSKQITWQPQESQNYVR